MAESNVETEDYHLNALAQVIMRYVTRFGSFLGDGQPVVAGLVCT